MKVEPGESTLVKDTEVGTISIHNEVLGILNLQPDNPTKIVLIGADANELSPLIIGPKYKSGVTLMEDLSSFSEVQSSEHYDYAYLLGYRASPDRPTNVRKMLGLLNHVSILIFSSDVPCSANRQISFWPSYWLNIFQENDCEVSFDLRSALWFDNRIPPRILESILLVHRRLR